MGAKLGNCVRCFDPTPAITTERLTFGGDTFEWELCDPHADMLRRDLYSWIRCGALVEEPRTFVSKRPPEERQRGTVIACHVQIPGARPAPSQTTTRPRSSAKAATQPRLHLMDLPAGYDKWSFTEHAVERMGQRRVRPEEALWAACNPEVVKPGLEPGTLAHTRGNIRVIVNPTTFAIITVIDTSNTVEQEYMNAASA